MNRPMPTHTRANTPYRPPMRRADGTKLWHPATFTVWRLPMTNQLGAGLTPLPLDHKRQP